MTQSALAALVCRTLQRPIETYIGLRVILDGSLIILVRYPWMRSHSQMHGNDVAFLILMQHGREILQFSGLRSLDSTARKFRECLRTAGDNTNDGCPESDVVSWAGLTCKKHGARIQAESGMRSFSRALSGRNVE